MLKKAALFFLTIATSSSSFAETRWSCQGLQIIKSDKRTLVSKVSASLGTAWEVDSIISAKFFYESGLALQGTMKEGENNFIVELTDDKTNHLSGKLTVAEFVDGKEQVEAMTKAEKAAFLFEGSIENSPRGTSQAGQTLKIVFSCDAEIAPATPRP